MTEATFYYDFSSPYAYFTAHRIAQGFPVAVRWQPILFGGLIGTIGKRPWSVGDEREAGMRECERRAAELGLPLDWPQDWPLGTYSVAVVRAALVAEEQGLVREFSLAAFRQGLGLGRDLRDLDVVVEAATEAGADVAALVAAAERPEAKQQVRAVTDAAVAAGITGIPTIDVAGRRFWGDDRFDDAVAAARG
ncbi:MAG: DsbA family protein [Patulibacter sp.]|nr:DsbA family protein [Patulibacter sp.]